MPLSAIFQLYHGDQFTKPGASTRCIGDRLVWTVRSKDLTHWTTRDLFLLYVFARLHCVLLLYIVYSWLQVHCVFFCCNLNFWCFMPLSAIFQLYHGDQFTMPGANPRCIGDRLVWAVRSNDLTHWTTRDLFLLHVFAWLQVHCVFFVVIWIWIFGVLWAVRSNDLTHWTTRDLFFCCMFLLDYRYIVYFLL